MVNTNYYWYETDNNKIGNKVITPLNQTIVKDVLGIYLISPIERKAVKHLPQLISKIENNTKMNMITHDENEKWSDDKMGEFKRFLETGYTELMNMRLEEAINTYVPQEEKRSWKKGEALSDFIGEKYRGSKKIEGTGLPQVKEKEKLRDMTLKDLLSSSNRDLFIGRTTKVGRSPEAKAQKKLDANMRKFTNEEFFDEDNLSGIKVTYVDKKKSRNKEGINVSFTVDQTDGKHQRKIFEDAGYSKIIFKDDPTSYGLSIRDKWSPNWDDTSAEGEFYQSKEGGKFDPISIWTGDSDQKETKRQEYIEELESEGYSNKKRALERLSGIGGRVGPLQKKLAKLKEQFKNLGSTDKEMYGLRLRTGKDKENLQNEIKDLEEFLDYVEKYHPKVWEGERTFAQERKYIEKLPSKVPQKYMTDRAVEAQGAASFFTDEKRSIQLTKANIDTITESWSTFVNHEIGDTSPIRELVKELISNGEIYDLIGPRANNSPWYLHRSSITLILHPKNIKNNKMYVPSIGKVETTKMVSKEALDQPAQMQSLRQRKNIALPVTRRTGQGATQMMQDPKGASEKLGINAARKYWVRKFITYHNKLKEAANTIGVSL